MRRRILKWNGHPAARLLARAPLRYRKLGIDTSRKCDVPGKLETVSPSSRSGIRFPLRQSLKIENLPSWVPVWVPNCFSGTTATAGTTKASLSWFLPGMPLCTRACCINEVANPLSTLAQLSTSFPCGASLTLRVGLASPGKILHSTASVTTNRATSITCTWRRSRNGTARCRSQRKNSSIGGRGRQPRRGVLSASFLLTEP
jgi:hypothetical protein